MLSTRKNIMILILLLVLGLITVLVMKMMVSMETGTIISVLLIPFLAYAVLSGAIEELGFGSVKAKFKDAASSKVSLSELGNMLPSSKDFDQVGQEGQSAIEHMLNTYKFNDTRPIVLSIKLGRGDYERVQMLAFLRQLLIQRSFKLVVFLDQYDRVIASMPGWAAFQLLADHLEGEKIISLINTNAVKELLDLPRVNQKQLTMQDTNVDALRQMSALNTEALAVVDQDRYLKGVLERDEVIAKMMLALVDKPTPL